MTEKAKERPILFSGPMVRAILEGRKTQTRRVLKTQPKSPITWGCVGGKGFGFISDSEIIKCTYGEPGDRLWVRENFWCAEQEGFGIGVCRLFYSADQDGGHYLKHGHAWDGIGMKFGHHPSIHMPRWASRITLEIKAVRVERIQDIKKDDIYAEGAITEEWLDWRSDAECVGLPPGSHIENERDVFEKLWDGINYFRAPWESNPWVFVIEFEVENDTM